MENKSPFLDTLFLLRKEGALTIFSDLKTLTKKEENEAEDFFESEFEKERLDFLSDRFHSIKNLPFGLRKFCITVLSCI